MNIKEKRIKTLPNSTIITSSFKCVYLFWVGEHSARTQWKQPNISLFECYLCLTPFLFCLLFWLCRGIGCINGGDFMLLCHPQCKRKTIDSAPTLFSSDYSHTHTSTWTYIQWTREWAWEREREEFVKAAYVFAHFNMKRTIYMFIPTLFCCIMRWAYTRTRTHTCHTCTSHNRMLCSQPDAATLENNVNR